TRFPLDGKRGLTPLWVRPFAALRGNPSVRCGPLRGLSLHTGDIGVIQVLGSQVVAGHVNPFLDAIPVPAVLVRNPVEPAVPGRNPGTAFPAAPVGVKPRMPIFPPSERITVAELARLPSARPGSGQVVAPARSTSAGRVSGLPAIASTLPGWRVASGLLIAP